MGHLRSKREYTENMPIQLYCGQLLSSGLLHLNNFVGNSNIYLQEWSEIIHPSPNCIIDAAFRQYVIRHIVSFPHEVWPWLMTVLCIDIRLAC